MSLLKGGTDYERLAEELPSCALENREERDYTKDKVGTLPPTVYSNANPNATARACLLSS